MSLFAVTLRHAAHSELLLLVEVIFWIYVPLSFIRVTGYIVHQVSAGRFLKIEKAPLPFKVPPFSGWLFVFCVLLLIFLQSPLYLVLVVTGMLAFLMENQRRARDQFGLKRLSPRQLFRWSLLICGAFIFVEIPLASLVDFIMTALRLPHPEQSTVVAFRQYSHSSQIAEFLIQAVVLFPFIEELFFRGFLLTYLKNYTSTWLALVLSAGVFAFAHANLGSVAQLWVLGIVLGVAYEHTGSLLLPIGIHGCFNLISALSLLLDKGNV